MAPTRQVRGTGCPKPKKITDIRQNLWSVVAFRMVVGISLALFTNEFREYLLVFILQNLTIRNCFSFFFFGCVGSSLLRPGFLVVARGGYSSLQCKGFSLRWILLLQSMGSRRAGFGSCSTQAQQLWHAGPRAQAQQLWCTSLVALRHVGSPWTRDRTRVLCIGRQIINHCATREVLQNLFFLKKKKLFPKGIEYFENNINVFSQQLVWRRTI